MVLILQVLFDEVGEQLLQHVSGILQLALQPRHDERGHVATVTHGEAALQLQRPDEGQQEDFVVDQLGKELQGLLHALLPVPLDLRWRRTGPSAMAWEDEGLESSPIPALPSLWGIKPGCTSQHPISQGASIPKHSL